MRQELDETVMLAHMLGHIQESKRLETELISQWPALSTVKDALFLGSFSWTSQKGGYKWLMSKNAVSTSAGWLSPAEIARAYLSVKYTARRRVTTDQYHEIMRHRSAPLYANPGLYGDCVYVDIKSAYWSILQVVGWDVEYFPGHWLGRKSDVRDFPFSTNKLARNSLVSSALSGIGKYWDGNKLVAVKKRNQFINMAIWSLVQDVLNSVANDMLKAGALYINTDGYIFRQENYDQAVEIFDAWGLPYSVKYDGTTEIVAAGTYSFAAKPNRRAPTIRPTYYKSVDGRYSEWLRPRFKKFSERLKMKLG